jgi:hypothetical protein
VTGEDGERDLARRWLAAAGDPVIAAELRTVYAHVADEVARRGPVCRASGRCCNFARAGHLLFVTGLEAALVVRGLGPGSPPLSDRTLRGALERGGCPFQVGRLCGVHADRPLGCRAYYCDPSWQAWQGALSEAALTDIRALHDRHVLPYRYAEWRSLLAMFVGRRGVTRCAGR